MGKLNANLVIPRDVAPDREPGERVNDSNPIHNHLSLEEQRDQAARCMDCGVPFCHGGRVLSGMASGCPLGNLIPEFNDLLYRGLYEAGLKRLLKTNPLPEFTGRVCPAPCEASCVQAGFFGGLADGLAVTIRENEYTLIELGMADLPPIATKLNGRRIAVIGSGPSGLAAAIRLRQLGFAPEVFEKADRPGGLLMYGIPNMKLEKSIVERRVTWMERSGITFHLKREISNISELSGFDAIVLCVGSRQPRDLNVKGREATGIHFAVDYLTDSTSALLNNAAPAITANGKRVVVIGGGDTGNDCVATAIRQGAKDIVQLEIMPRPPESRQPNNPWPEWNRSMKVDYGQEEAIDRQGGDPRIFEASTQEIIGTDGKAEKLIVKVRDEIREFPAELVLLAMGFTGPEKGLIDSLNLPTDERGRLVTDGYLVDKSRNLYACGDVRRGQSLVVWAIREGVEAAESIFSGC